MISIVIACRNEAASIGSFLDSLVSQDAGGLEWEAIIADGFSDDGTREIVEGYCARDPRLKMIMNPGRIVSTGLNLAIRASRGDIILRMDAHTRYASDYCLRSVETLARTGADNAGGPARTAACDGWGGAIAAAYHSRFSTGGARFHDESYEGWVDTVPYGCWRKTTLEQIGGFDESLARNQDDELNLRLLRSGCRIWQSPAIRSWYSPRSTLSGLFRQYFQYGFWKVAVIRKHRLPGSWRHLVPGACLIACAMLLGLATCGFTFCGELCLALAGAYAVADVTASVVTAARHGWTLVFFLPLIFAVYHVAYGAGFIAGMSTHFRRARESFANARPFTRLSR